MTLCCCLAACSTVTTTRIGVNYMPGTESGLPTRGPAKVFLKSGEALDFQIHSATPTALHGMAVGSGELRSIQWDYIERLEKSDVDGTKTTLLIVGILAVVLLIVNSAVNSVAAQIAPSP